MMYKRPNTTYQEIAVQTSSPTKLVVMLYEGVIRFLQQSISAIESNDLDTKRQAVDRAVAVIQHLQNTLDMDRGGQVAAELDRLYSYIHSRILEGSTKLQIVAFEEAIKLLTLLLSGWEEAARKEEQHAVPTTLLTGQAANTGRFRLHV
jgi:flagellar secretion chaperone FliS